MPVLAPGLQSWMRAAAPFWWPPPCAQPFFAGPLLGPVLQPASVRQCISVLRLLALRAAGFAGDAARSPRR
eukprot:15436847-Alexandrium_andersonii.AAC.1